jgi:hypothetical protein
MHFLTFDLKGGYGLHRSPRLALSEHDVSPRSHFSAHYFQKIMRNLCDNYATEFTSVPAGRAAGEKAKSQDSDQEPPKSAYHGQENTSSWHGSSSFQQGGSTVLLKLNRCWALPAKTLWYVVQVALRGR